MPTRDWTFRISDIIDAINKIESYSEGMTCEAFCTSGITADAVGRNIEIIGEAAKHVPDDVREQYGEIPWRLMGGMRNIMIHEYFGVDLETVWYTIANDLVPIREKLESIIKKAS